MSKNKDKILSQTLITGASGMIGSYIDFGLKTDRRSLDITDLDEVLAVCRKYRPKIIIHLAAETDVGRCEREPQYAYFVNAIGTYNMVIVAKEIGAKFIYISTSAVFSGTKNDPYTEKDAPDPQGYYGRSKFLGEAIVQNILKNYIIARICWVFGGGPKKDQKFVAKIMTQLNQPEIKAITGMYGSPTYGKDVVAAIKIMITEDQKGIFHLSNKGVTSRIDLIKEIITITNSKSKVVPVDQAFFNQSQSVNKISNEGMTSRIHLMGSWQKALKEYIQNEWPDYINKN